MRKFGALAFAAVFVFALAGCNGGDPVGVVDTSRLFQESDSGKAGLAHLQAMEAAMQEQLVAAQAMLEKSPNDEALRAHFQKEFGGYQAMVQAEQQKVVETINAQITEAMEKARKKGKFSVILPSENVLAFDPKADITDDMIKLLNKAPVTFEPVALKAISAPKADDKADAGKAEAPKAEAKPEAPKADDKAPADKPAGKAEEKPAGAKQ